MSASWKTSTPPEPETPPKSIGLTMSVLYTPPYMSEMYGLPTQARFSVCTNTIVSKPFKLFSFEMFFSLLHDQVFSSIGLFLPAYKHVIISQPKAARLDHTSPFIFC